MMKHFHLQYIPEVYSFCLDNPEVVGNFFGAMYFDDKAADLFIELVSMEEIRNNPILIYGLDRNQIRVFSSLAYGISDEEIKSNISGNVKYFRDNPDLYKVVPFMLDGENAKKILDLLSTQGLDMNKLDKLDINVSDILNRLIITYLLDIYPLVISEDSCDELLVACILLVNNMMSCNVKSEKMSEILAKRAQKVTKMTEKINILIESV